MGESSAVTAMDLDSERRRLIPLKPSARRGLLILLGGASFICYWLLMSIALNPKLQIVYSVKGATYGGPLVWPSRWFHLATLPALTRMWLFMFLVIALTLMWLAAIYVVRKDSSRGTALIIGGAFLLFALLFVFGPTFQSKDVFSYIFHGRAMSVYHSNPYLLIPHARTGDVFYPLIGWKFNASVYGPVYNFISYAITKVAGNSVAANVLGFKVMTFAFYAACLPMVHWLTRRLTPGKENMALLITACCPILVMHTLGGAHNDIIAVAVVLAGYILYRKGYLLSGIAIVMVAVMVKIVAVFALAPMLVLYVRDKRGAPLKRVIAAGAACVGVAVLLYLPFLKNLKIFKTTSHMSGMYSASSIPRVFTWLYAKVFGSGGAASSRLQLTANSRVHLVFLGIAGILGILLLLGVKDYRSMTLCAGSLVLVWFLTSTYVVPWYLALGLALAALTGWNATTGALVAAATIFTLYPMVGHLGVPLLVVLVIWTAIFGSSELKKLRWHSRKRAVRGQQEELDGEEA